MKKYFISILALFTFNFSFSQLTNSDIVAELKIEAIENAATVIAISSNKTDLYQSLKYKFSINSFDSNNDPYKETIEDMFTLDPYQSKNLYRSSILTDDENKIVVSLLIYDQDDNIVAKSRIVFNEKDEDKVQEKVNLLNKLTKVLNEESTRITKDTEEVFSITGIVVEDTKTKNGKDFYDKFYFLYSYNNINGNQVVKVEEMFTFRTSTKIMIKIDDEVVIEFFARSNEEYLDEMAKISIQRVSKYFEIKKKQKSYITQY